MVRPIQDFIELKTDYSSYFVGNEYRGDYFDYADYNQMVDNLNYLFFYASMAKKTINIGLRYLPTMTANDFFTRSKMLDLCYRIKNFYKTFADPVEIEELTEYFPDNDYINELNKKINDLLPIFENLGLIISIYPDQRLTRTLGRGKGEF